VINTGTNSNLLPTIEIDLPTVMEEHLREELRIANVHLVNARNELRKFKGTDPADYDGEVEPN
jgi:hypothetical protein